jgi:hypothetical protein
MPNETMTREEWERRFAARLVEAGGLTDESAAQCAKAAADENLEFNGDEWLDPEDDADVELSNLFGGEAPHG